MILISIGCKNEKSTLLDQEKKDTIINEIEVTLNSLHNAWKIRDLTTAFSYFPDTSNFNYVGADAVIMDYAGFIKMCHEIFDNSQVIKLESLDRTIKIVTSELVIAYTLYKWEMTELKTDTPLYIFKIGSTFIFRKINDRWIVTHLHESYLEPEKTSQ
jgi:ketosteroid isomerase-like protein